MTRNRNRNRGRGNRSIADYDVGYGKPPAEHQFKKGMRSPNPKGRPPRDSTFIGKVSAALRAPITVKIGGETRQMPFSDALIESVKQKALAGDPRSVRTVVEWLQMQREFEETPTQMVVKHRVQFVTVDTKGNEIKSDDESDSEQKPDDED